MSRWSRWSFILHLSKDVGFYLCFDLSYLCMLSVWPLSMPFKETFSFALGIVSSSFGWELAFLSGMKLVGQRPHHVEDTAFVRSAKLSNAGSGQYLNGWQSGYTRCFWLFWVILVWDEFLGVDLFLAQGSFWTVSGTYRTYISSLCPPFISCFDLVGRSFISFSWQFFGVFPVYVLEIWDDQFYLVQFP